MSFISEVRGFEEVSSDEVPFNVRLTVIGLGGAGGNAVANMIGAKLEGVKFVVANTDMQSLRVSPCSNKIQMGRAVTGGLGAGAKPEVGRQAAMESSEEIMQHIEDSDMLFITAGMGGGTGTGAAEVVAKLAREKGILTVAVVTKPFDFEGNGRLEVAKHGITELEKYVDTMIVVSNENLFRVANESTSFSDAFKIADDVLYSGVKCITDLVTMPGLINLDFADIRTIMMGAGRAMIGAGEAAGPNRAISAVEMAITNPLLENNSVSGASGLLVNITGGENMTLFEVSDVVNRVSEKISSDTKLIFGSIFNEAMNDTIRVSVVATGVDGSGRAQVAVDAAAANDQANKSSTQPRTLSELRKFMLQGDHQAGDNPMQHVAQNQSVTATEQNEAAEYQATVANKKHHVAAAGDVAMGSTNTANKLRSTKAMGHDEDMEQQLIKRNEDLGNTFKSSAPLTLRRSAAARVMERYVDCTAYNNGEPEFVSHYEKAEDDIDIDDADALQFQQESGTEGTPRAARTASSASANTMMEDFSGFNDDDRLKGFWNRFFKKGSEKKKINFPSINTNDNHGSSINDAQGLQMESLHVIGQRACDKEKSQASTTTYSSGNLKGRYVNSSHHSADNNDEECIILSVFGADDPIVQGGDFTLNRENQ